ncbi:hypothetical protein RUM44_003215 [Polyplax serrata]|uniref:Uncharacterized protein n=1 Tax=Polyplax serrata TaxID=468196 RepID=A0ABR1AXW4_POLSC
MSQPGYIQHRSGYWTDGEESQRAPSDKNGEYYTVANERSQLGSPPKNRIPKSHKKNTDEPRLHTSVSSMRPTSQMSYMPGHRAPSSASARSDRKEKNNERPRQNSQPYEDSGSDVYVTSGAYRAPSEISRGSKVSRYTRGVPSQYSYRSGAAPSELSTVKTKTSRKGGAVVETMSAPNPFCPNTKGLCCLLLLINLGLILITLGFVIVMQFFEPLFIWILGIVFLIFGFIALNVSLIYCVSVCKDMKSPKEVAMQDNYWTHHWQKNFGLPEIHYKSEDKFPDSDRGSDRYSISKYSAKYSDKNHPQKY